MDRLHPNICNVLSDHSELFGKTSTCQEWPQIYLNTYGQLNASLVEEMYSYGRQNLAMVHVVMQSPHVTKIKRDVAMTFTTYVANTGKSLLY